MTKQKKFILAESEIPTQWYNILAGNQATIDLAGFGAYIPRGMFKTGIGYGASLD